MIRLHANQYAALCAHRQADHAAALAAVAGRDGNWLQVDETHPAYPRARPGLGDIVAAGLSAVGVTPERVSAALGVKDCGCKKRQAALNRLGARLGLPPGRAG